ncbi:MAG: hypothetical protein K2Y23_20295 [Cyanobacteria bacterium]|nr:hypothetical protein [Cyanobacteriota bacterium]
MLGGFEGVAHFLFDFVFHLPADFAGGAFAIFDPRLGELLLHVGAHAGFRIGDARPRGLLGFFENLDLGRANALVARLAGLIDELFDEWSYGLIDGGLDAIFE